MTKLEIIELKRILEKIPKKYIVESDKKEMSERLLDSLSESIAKMRLQISVNEIILNNIKRQTDLASIQY